MRRRVGWVTGVMAAGALGAVAQTHKVEKPQAVVRAIGVYEWTGELKSPKASRLVPVTVFIDGELHDAGVYQPRPIPFALEPGVEYEVQQAGAPEGMLVLETARHRTPDDNGEGDAWFGYGRYKTQAAVKAAAPLRPSKNLPVILSSKDPDAGGQTGAGRDSAGGSQKDNGRPTMRRRGSTESEPQTSGGASGSDGGAGSSGGAGQGTGSAGAGNDRETNASDDVDRPTLKRRTPAEDKKERKKGDQPSVTARSGPEADPDRPVLHRGGGTSDLGEGSGLPELLGTPADLQQAVAVSDAATRPEHSYTRAWADDAERVAILAKMQALARTQLAGYHSVASPKEMGKAEAQVESDPGHPTLRRGVPRNASAKAGAATGTTQSVSGSARAGSGATGAVGANSRTGSQTRTAKAQGVTLAEEQLKGFTLSYGAQPTFVYTAQTGGESVPRYVTVVAEQEVSGDLRVVLRSVTDAGHLDRTPWMRFVDAVDAEASNRASLLFELRYAGSRSFALYRVLGESATQLATTGGI